MFQTAHFITTDEGVDVLIREAITVPSGSVPSAQDLIREARADPSGDAPARTNISESQ